MHHKDNAGLVGGYQFAKHPTKSCDFEVYFQSPVGDVDDGKLGIVIWLYKGRMTELNKM